MLATGGLLMAIALLTLAAVAPVFRSDSPPRWATRGWVGELVTLAIVCTMAIGVGYLGAGAIDAFQTGADYLDLGLLGVVLFVSVVLWRRVKAGARRKAVAPDGSVHALAPGSGRAHSETPRAGTAPAPATGSVPPPPKAA